MKYIHIYLLVIIALLSCGNDSNDDPKPSPNPDPAPEQSVITASNPFPCINEEITLSYFVQGESSATWIYNGETISTKKEAKITFDKNGTYTIKLEVINDKGIKNEYSTDIEVMGEKLSIELAKLAKSDKFWICAHRANTYKGLTDGANMAPENSIKAIETAIEKGAEMIEIDIRVTSDNEFVIMHDKSVNRTTDGSGNVSNMPLSQVKTLSLKDNAGKVTEHKVPTLKEALEAGRGKIYYNIDLGGMISEGWTRDHTKKLIATIEENHMIDRTIFYIGSNQGVGNDMIAANKNALLFPWISTMANLSDWSIAKVIQIAPEASVDIINAALAKDAPSFSNHLTTDDEALVNNKDYSKLDNLVNKKIKIIQTDYAELVDEYVNK